MNTHPSHDLVEALRRRNTIVQNKRNEPKLKVQMTISRVASVYEKVRNAIDYQDEHLIRKNAIERILKRRIYQEVKRNNFGPLLISELIRAKYLPNDRIPERVVEEIEVVITKYLPLLRTYAPNRLTKERRDASNWLISVLATEIEHRLVPPMISDAMIEFMYKVIRKDVEFGKELQDEDEQNTQLYIAIHRVLNKSDIGIIRFHLLYFRLPGWLGGDQRAMADLHQNFHTIKQDIDARINHPLQDQIFRFTKRFSALFTILRDIIEEDPRQFEYLIQNQEEFEKKIRETCETRYLKAKKKLTRSYVRTVIYIFITKMILAFVLELPYELFVIKVTDYTPLIINVVFHPLLMLLIAASIRMPSQENTDKIVELLSKSIYEEPYPGFLYQKKKAFRRNRFVERFFQFIYFITFIISFGALVWAMVWFKFNIVSILLFLFFLTVVSFFGMKLRGQIRDLMVVPQKENFFAAVVNFFSLPILRVGQWVSAKTPKINIFLFILDFIIEAPFKLFIEVAEDWVSYQREKKEEIF